jgi:hypothetical protein
MNMYGDRLRKSEWEVLPLKDLGLATALVEKYHYAHGGSNTATYLHGLFRRDDRWKANCLGVAWWLPPTKSAALATYPENWQGVLSLSRLVVVPDVPKNAATFLMSQSRKLIDRNVWPCLVTYADDWRGHVGTIYRADNWQFVGKTKPQPVYVKDGRMVARKSGPHTRTHTEMLALGCELLGRFSKSKYLRLPANTACTRQGGGLRQISLFPTDGNPAEGEGVKPAPCG